MKIVRVLVYEGEAEDVLNEMDYRSVKGSNNGEKVKITEYFITNSIRVEHVTLTGGDPYKEG